VDTYWQTETGSFVLAPYSTATPTKSGSATLPQFGILPEILDPESGKVIEGNNFTGVLALRHPWPSMARTVYNNHKRFMDTYLTPYRGHYFTGDGAFRDQDGYYWILGRVDDVINVSGHRLSTAEIESALVLHPSCSEAAVIGVPDDITGQHIVAFCCLKAGTSESAAADLRKELVVQVRKVIGPFAAPKKIVVVHDLPKTRSGKIMRRILRKIACNEAGQLGDLSTLADSSIIQVLIEKVASS
jgi:acetyl-CoA synthetase